MNDNKQKEVNDFTVQYDQEYNPTIHSKNSLYPLQFYQTRESMMDVEHYKKFLENAISRFRRSKTYKHYKGYLIGLGLDHCQILPNIRADLEEDGGKNKLLEMHHNFLTIYEIALIITEHVLNTKGFICTFDLVQLLKEEHKNNCIPLVMLSKTVHQVYHNSQDFVIPANMCFGFWQELIQKYNKGITIEIANKVINYIQRSLEVEDLSMDFTNNLLELRDDILGWSQYNEYADTPRISTLTYMGE